MNNVGAIWIRFDHPAWLPAMVASFVPVAWAILRRRRGNRVGWVGVALQCLALLLAAVSLTGPVIPSAMRPPRWLVLRDVSASVGRQVDIPLNLPADVVFAPHAFAGRLSGEDERDDLAATRLGPVLAWSTAAVQAGKADGAILVTDGRFQDDWQSAAREYAKTDAPLWIVPLDAPPTDARIAAFTAVRKGASKKNLVTYDLAISVQSNISTRRTVQVFRISTEGKPLLTQSEVVLEPNRPTTIHVRDTFPADSAGVWLAELTPHDALPQNDTYQTAVLPRTTRVAWVAGRSVATIPGVKIVQISPVDAPTKQTGYLGYSCVVLADATGKRLSAPRRSALAEHVRGGGGLVLIGAGPHDKPADRDDPLSQILPLHANPFERNPLHLTVVLDASGSMAELTGAPAQPKWFLASQAVLALREHLTQADSLRVIVFADTARTIYESPAEGPAFSRIADALRTIRPGGPTNIAPALDRALQTSPRKNATNLVLVLSDLQTAPFHPAVFAKPFKEQHRNLAVVATGSPEDQNTPLAQLAKQLRAPLVYRGHLQGLADVFARLCRQTRGDAIRRGEFIVRYNTAWPKDARVRRINAYIPAGAVGGCRVDARIESTGDPLLAGRSAGLGKVVVVSAPPEAFLSEQGGDVLLKELLRRTKSPNDDPRFDVQAVRNADRLLIRAAVRDHDRAVNNLSLSADVLRLSDPAARPTAAEFRQTAPGVYEADFPLPANEPSLAVRLLGDKGVQYWQGVVPANYPSEFSRLGTDYEILRELADITGGRIVERTALNSPEIQKQLRLPRRLGKNIRQFTLAGAVAAMLFAWLAGSMRRQSHSITV